MKEWTALVFQDSQGSSQFNRCREPSTDNKKGRDMSFAFLRFEVFRDLPKKVGNWCVWVVLKIIGVLFVEVLYNGGILNEQLPMYKKSIAYEFIYNPKFQPLLFSPHKTSETEFTWRLLMDRHTDFQNSAGLSCSNELLTFLWTGKQNF